MRAIRQAGTPMPSLSVPVNGGRKGCSFWAGDGGRTAHIQGPLFPSRQTFSAHDLTQPSSPWADPGGRTLLDTHQPPCPDKSGPNGSSLAGSHLDSQERTVFTHSDIMG